MTTELPEKPESRKESYLAKIAGESVTIPEKPESRIEQYLAYIAEHGGGGGGGDVSDVQINGTSIVSGGIANIPYALVTLSQADYDALIAAGTVDANTYYFITESSNRSLQATPNLSLNLDRTADIPTISEKLEPELEKSEKIEEILEESKTEEE